MATKAQIIDFLLAGYRSKDTDYPLAGGTVEVYTAGTSTPAFLWNDRDKTLPTPTGISTVTLDAYGKAEVYGDGVYKFIIKDASAATVETIDYYNASDVSVTTSATSGAAVDWDAVSDTPAAGKIITYDSELDVDLRKYSSLASGNDWLAALNAANDEAFNSFASDGRVRTIVIHGPIEVSDEFRLKWQVNIRGIGRDSKITAQAAGYPIISFHPTQTSFTKNSFIRDIALIGAGNGDDGVSHGIACNHPFGLDFFSIDNVRIEQCGGNALHFLQSNSPTYNCIQQSRISNVFIDDCYRGIGFMGGFIGSLLFENVTIQNCTNTAIFSQLTNAIGIQDIKFHRCDIQFSPYGFYTASASALKVVFDSCHFEQNTNNDIYIDSNIFRNLTLLDCSFTNTPIAIYLKSINRALLTGNHFNFTGVDDGSQRYLKIDAGFVQIDGGNVQQTVLTTPVEAASSDNIIGYNNLSFDQFKGYYGFFRGIGKTTTQSRNLSGQQNVSNGASSQAVTFTRTEADTSYFPFVRGSWGSTFKVDNADKSTTGFTVHFGTNVPSTGHYIDWFIVR